MGKLVVANWKMNKTIGEAEEFCSHFNKKADNYIICCSATLIKSVFDCLKNSNNIGAQNICAYEEGAYTGEISAKMVKDAGANVTILGHSERRHIFNETNDDLRKKLDIANKYGLQVIFCVGETLEEHDNIESVLVNQLKILTKEDLGNLIIAYEPVWAIGTGKVATEEDILVAHKIVKEYVKRNLGSNIKVLYGGSVKPENAAEILRLNCVDGVLVGGASLDPVKFESLIKTANEVL
ncbi:MAG: triose-phosphate isomerase [bacterium]|nr:triose-phosphate isomerase [bacterium]